MVGSAYLPIDRSMMLERHVRLFRPAVLGAVLLLAACGTDNPVENNTTGNNTPNNTSSQNNTTGNNTTGDNNTTGQNNTTGSNNANCFGNEVFCDGRCIDPMTENDHCGACGNSCGAAASCSAGVCECGEGANDCNGDIGTTGSDGCECVGTCDGQQCVVTECDVDTAFSCSNDDGTVCNAGQCETCDAGTTNCDGLGSNGCECTLPCDNGECPACDYDVAGGCNGDTSMWCSSGTCTACEAGKTNCDTRGTCECAADCDDGMCTALACTYDQEDACNGDDSMWCSTIAMDTCTPCSEGFFNCNNTAGCECDAAGCNGQVCAGQCFGGECP